MDKRLLLGVWCAVFLLVPLVSAYNVNQPLTINVKLQYDNGTTLSDVLSSACVASIYDKGNSSLVVRDQAMTPGTFHSIVFTPTEIAEYALSVKCSYNNETATYFEVFTITQAITPSGGGGQVLNLNVKIAPEKSDYVVNLRSASELSFPIQYFVDGYLSDSHQATWKLIKDDKVLASGAYQEKTSGVYTFDYDFKDVVVGDYKLFLYFDGRMEIVDVHVVSVDEAASLVGNAVLDSAGKFSPLKAGLAGLFILFVLLMFVVLWKQARK